MEKLILTIGFLCWIFVFQIIGQKQNAKPKSLIINCHNCKIISLPKREYPKTADAINVSGYVKVQVLIDEQGNVVEAKAISGHIFLQGEAEKAAYKARFEPATLSGKPVKMRSEIVYNFIPKFSAQIEENKQSINQEKIVRGGIVNGKATYLPKPEYTEEVKSFCASGKVEVEVLIDENGDVILAQAIYGDELLLDSAVEAAKKAKFRHTDDFPPIKVKGIIVYNYVSERKCVALNRVVNKRAKYLPKPIYPKSCRCQGIIKVRIVVDMSGNVISARADSGNPLLKVSAVEAARKTKFSPMLTNSPPIFVTAFLEYKFYENGKVST